MKNKKDLPLPKEKPIKNTANPETLRAMQEAEDILAGKIPAKRFQSTEEMFAELDRLCDSARS